MWWDVTWRPSMITRTWNLFTAFNQSMETMDSYTLSSGQPFAAAPGERLVDRSPAQGDLSHGYWEWKRLQFIPSPTYIFPAIIENRTSNWTISTCFEQFDKSQTFHTFTSNKCLLKTKQLENPRAHLLMTSCASSPDLCQPIELTWFHTCFRQRHMLKAACSYAAHNYVAHNDLILNQKHTLRSEILIMLLFLRS